MSPLVRARTGAAASGVTNTVTQTGHGFTVGQLVRYNGTVYVLAEADAAGDADVDGMVSAVADANTFTIQIGGYVTGLSGLVAGADYFLSPTVPGGLTTVDPSAAGQVSKPMLHADTAASGYLINMRGLVIPQAAITYVLIKLVDDATSITIGDGKFAFVVTSDLNGLALASVVAMCTVAPTGTGLSFGVRKNAATEMLSTNVTIDTTKKSSELSAAPPVIKSDGSQLVATGDVVWIDCDQADSNSASRGAAIRLGFS